MTLGRPLILSAIAILLLASPAAAAGRDMIVTFHNPPGAAEEALIRQAGGRIERRLDFIRGAQVSVPEGAVESLRRHPAVASLQNNNRVGIAPSPLRPLSPRSGSRFSPVGEYDPSWGVQRMGANILHDMAAKGATIKVAILDTGIDKTHPDLKKNPDLSPVVAEKDFMFDDADATDDSIVSHGTHVAGIIAARSNGKGVVGVAPDVELYVAKVLDRNGFGLEATIEKGIEWAIEKNVDIINMSMQLPVSEAMRKALADAEKAGILVVAAAGNSNGQEMPYPESYDKVIFVTATDRNDALALFSAVGARADFAAPGVQITSTIRGGGYGELSGTSMAAPHVTGAAALLLSAGPKDLDGDGKADFRDVRLQLQQLALDLGEGGRDAHFGFGLAQVVPNFTLSRISAYAGKDARTMELPKGTHEVLIRNTNLTAVMVRVFDASGFPVRNQSRLVRFKRRGSAVADFTITAAGPLEVDFTPLGTRGGTAQVFVQKRP